MAVDKVNVLNDQGVSKMLEEVFQTVENNYIRRTQHASDMAALEGKLTDGSVTKLTKQTIGSEKVGIYLKDGVPTPTEGAVPDNHADPTTKFGGGTTVNYGHVKLSDEYTSSAGSANQSVAASSKAVADALTAGKAYIDDVGSSTLSSANSHADSVAAGALADAKTYADNKPNVPTDHSSTATTYGGGNASKFGHVKVSDTVDNTSASSSIAASPKAVADALNAAKTYIDAVGSSTLSSANSHADSVAAGALADAKTYMASEVDKMFGEALTFEVIDGNLYVSYNVTSTAQFSINSDGNLVMTY